MHDEDTQKERILVEKAKHDPAAFAELYDLYFPKVFCYVSWRVGNRSDTEDLVADIFLAVLREIRSFKHHRDAAFSSWLFRIAYNKVVDYHRTRRQRDDLSIHDLPDIPDVSILPADDLDRRLLFKELYQMIQELPERQQEVVTMRFFAGMKNKEIAKALGISERSVASSLCRGLQSLHAKFSKGKQ